MFGQSIGGWLGGSDFAISVETKPDLAAFFIFQLMFCGTSTTIVSGAVAERLRFVGYLIICAVCSGPIYPVFGHWVWNGIQEGQRQGWLGQLGFSDFAGSTVVHGVGAWVSLAALLVVGPRTGRFDAEGRSRKIGSSNLPFSMLGAMFLWMGWLGFNGGSTLALNDQVPPVIVHTLVAGVAGMLTGGALSFRYRKIPDVEWLINGSLAGMVAVTACCNVVSTPIAILVGAVGATIAVGIEGWLERLHIDDAVSAVAIHGGAGAWGTLSVGLFGDLDRLGVGIDRPQQILVQLLGIGVAFLWAFGVAYTLLSWINRFFPLRVSSEDEEVGLNMAEHRVKTEIYDLFQVMDRHARSLDLQARAPVDSFTEAGYIAARYNQVLDTVQAKSEELVQLNASLEETVRDRTAELEAANRELQRLDRLKDEFLANTSHELRTPLNGIVGIAESLTEGAAGELSNIQQQNLQYIVESGQRLGTLVSDILDFSKLKRKTLDLNLRSVGLRAMVATALRMHETRAAVKGLVLANTVSSELPPVLADENRLQQILHNLIGNAIKFTEHGGVQIAAEVRRGGELPGWGGEVGEPYRPGDRDRAGHERSSEDPSRDHAYLQITISDTGIGIPAEAIERIFVSFEQADGDTARTYGGTGLGLAITQQLIQVHGGQIWVESTPNVGSRFHFTLPLAEQEDSTSRSSLGMGPTQALLSEAEAADAPPSRPAVVERLLAEHRPKLPLDSEPILLDQEKGRRSKEKGAAKDPPSSFPQSPEAAAAPPGTEAPLAAATPSPGDETGFKILIVDDEPINLQVLYNYLSLDSRYTVRRAGSGPEALAAIEGDFWPDAILLDVMMPKMTGYEVAEKLRERYPAGELPILMLTAKSQTEDIVQGLDSGANDYLVKPISRKELLARLQTHLQLSRINTAYGRFVPHEFLQLLEKDSIVDVALGDQVEKRMSILFSDIRDFTSLSEQMTPEDNFRFVNAYLSRMEPAIVQHHGFIDKYIGDAIVALFPRSPDDAIDAAVAMLRAIERYNEARQQQDRLPIRVGIGINTGVLRLGTVGGPGHMSSTVISDSVNLASRIEGLTKRYGLSLLISHHVLAELENPDRYQLRFVDRVSVKGRSQPAALFEVLNGDRPDQRSAKLAQLGEFEAAAHLFHRGKFREAAGYLEDCLRDNPEDGLLRYYLEQATQRGFNPRK